MQTDKKEEPKKALISFGGAGPVLAVMAFTVAALFGILFVIGGSKAEGFAGLRAAIALPLLLMLGLGTLLLLLTAMVSVLDRFGLTNPDRAFGLPDGSMQAVIALSLVLIFVIASLYLYSSLPVSVTPDQESAQRDRFDFAKQLLTTVGTLAVAVAGFYFGTRSVEVAALATRNREPETPPGEPDQPEGPEETVEPVQIVGAEGPSPLTLGPDAPIQISTTPADQRVIGYVAAGDDAGKVEQVAPGEFRYVRGPDAESIVTLAFQLADGTGRREVEVKPQDVEMQNPQ